jgi:hypothetical protein
MSMIIDGMDQSHCKCPYLGTNQTFPVSLSQQITAIKEHGWGVRIFRTLETVGKGANLTIHCILSQIEDWKIRHQNRYPEKIFLQVDGGSENANQYLLTMLELLVSKRMAKTIYFTRLPTGKFYFFNLFVKIIIPLNIQPSQVILTKTSMGYSLLYGEL